MTDYKNKKEFLAVAREAVERAGKILCNFWGRLNPGMVAEKSRNDFVTTVDRQSEEVIVRFLREKFPGHGILGEEYGQKEGEEAEYRWLIDPLDGTTNYIHGFPFFAVSLALQYKEETICGVINDPLRQEIFWAVAGGGAYRNGEPIRVSQLPHLRGGLFATGFPFRAHHRLDFYLDIFKEIFLASTGIRRAGAAALDLAYTACGRIDGFWELNLSPWDIAAGDLLVREAGGVVSDLAAGDKFLNNGDIVAANPFLHRLLIEAIQKVVKDFPQERLTREVP